MTKSQPELDIQLQTVKDPALLRHTWLALQEKADCHYFLSWGWIESWLQQVQEAADIRLLSVMRQQQPVALALVPHARIRRRRVISSRCWYLNEYPLHGHNLVIEYNGLLIARGEEQAVLQALLRWFAGQSKQVDEWLLGAVTDALCKSLRTAVTPPLRLLENDASGCYQADLAPAQEGFDSYLASLSRNSREQIRRSRRFYQQRGEIRLRAAQTAEQALAWLEAMKQLHQSRWQAKGERGAFGNPNWEQFHRRLIAQRFDAGEVQMLCVRAGDHDFAYLYNHLWRKRVYVQQMGFAFEDDNRARPGYLAHALAIVHNAAHGHQCYDFMHGEARYKRSLSHHKETLHWLTLQQPRWRFALERAAVCQVRRWRGLSDDGQ